MTRFTERLWRELVREHGSDLAQIDRSATGPRYARPRLLAGTTVAIAAIGVAIVLVLSAASTPAAFAVTGNSDGTVSVVLRKIAGVKGANEKLAALGVRAKFVEVLPGCHATLPPAAVANVKTPGEVLIHTSRQTRIDPRKIPRGRVLMIVSWSAARTVHVARVGASVATAPDCIAGPPPRALHIAWAMAHGCHVHVTSVGSGIVVGKPGKAWTITREHGTVTGEHGTVTGEHGAPTGEHGAPTGESGAVTGESGAVTGESGAVTQIGVASAAAGKSRPSREIRMANGCPKPTAALKTPPATGNSGSTTTP